MYLPTRDESVPACEKTPLHTIATVLASLGWSFFYFLLVAYLWLLYKSRKAALEAYNERDSLLEDAACHRSQIHCLRDCLRSNNYLLQLEKDEVARLRREQAQVFVVGDDSDSDSGSDNGSDNGSIGDGRDSLDVTSNTGSVFSTSLRPAPARTPTPTRALTPVPAPTPSEQAGDAKPPGPASIAGETPEDAAQKEDESMSRPASPELSTTLSERSLAYELAVAQAGEDEDCASVISSARPSTEVR